MTIRETSRPICPNLEKGDYLTAKQVRQASRENITLQNGQAVVQ